MRERRGRRACLDNPRLKSGDTGVTPQKRFVVKEREVFCA
jgi:hypothetical protein